MPQPKRLIEIIKYKLQKEQIATSLIQDQTIERYFILLEHYRTLQRATAQTKANVMQWDSLLIYVTDVLHHLYDDILHITTTLPAWMDCAQYTLVRVATEIEHIQEYTSYLLDIPLHDEQITDNISLMRINVNDEFELPTSALLRVLERTGGITGYNQYLIIKNQYHTLMTQYQRKKDDIDQMATEADFNLFLTESVCQRLQRICHLINVSHITDRNDFGYLVITNFEKLIDFVDNSMI